MQGKEWVEEWSQQTEEGDSVVCGCMCQVGGGGGKVQLYVAMRALQMESET
jgi:hypothetical protein